MNWRSLFPLQDDPTGQRKPCHTCGRLCVPLDLGPSNTCSKCHEREYALRHLEWRDPLTKAEVKDAAAVALMFYALSRDVRAGGPPFCPVSITRQTHYGEVSFQVTDLRTGLFVDVPTKRRANWVAETIDDDRYLAAHATA